MRCMNHRCCGALWESIWGAHRCRTRAPSFSSVTCWRNTNWGGDAERGEPVSGEPRHPHHHGDDCGRNHYSCAFVDQEPEWRARPGDASDAQGKAVVLRAEGTHRSGLQARPCAFGVHVGGFGGGQAHAAGPAARRGAQGVGRRWISGTGRNHPAGGSASARYDQPESEVQELCGQVTKGQEPGEGQSASEGGTSVPDSEAHLRFREGAIPRDSEESSSAVRQLCPGEPVPAPQTAGGGEGVVSLKAACMAASGKVGSNTGKIRGLCRSEIPGSLKIDGCSEVP